MANPAWDLTTLAYVLNDIPGTPTAADLAQLPNWITSYSKKIARYCKRLFVLSAFDEILRPEIGTPFTSDVPTVQLKVWPVQSITRAAGSRTPALLIVNTDSVTNQRATVQVTATGDPEIQLLPGGVTLTAVASGVATATTLLFATYPTVNSLAAAINALGAGWQATVTTGSGPYNFGLMASADLIAEFTPVGCLQGALSGVAGATLDIFATDMDLIAVDRAAGVYTVNYGAAYGSAGLMNAGLWPGATPLDNGMGGWQPAVRIGYTAGWATIPEQVQDACSIAVQARYFRSNNPSYFESETIGAYSYRIAEDARSGLPRAAMELLAEFRQIEA